MVSKLLFLLAGGLAVSAAPCEEPALRKEWREMSADEQGAYVKAVHCLASKPSRIGLNTTLYDDFPYIHNVLNNDSESGNTQHPPRALVGLLLIWGSSLRGQLPPLAPLLRCDLRGGTARVRI